MQIAIDGPAGAGKSTVARQVADRLGYLYLDTGAMYRALGLGLAELGTNPDDAEQVEAALPGLHVEIAYKDGTQRTLLNGKDVSELIRSQKMGDLASRIARLKSVREYLVAAQREIASSHDIIMDGRDIGSAVLPNADFKFFLTATPRARALRRKRELELKGEACDLDATERQIIERDRQDMTREYSPLTHTPGEKLIDTSSMTQDEVVDELCGIISGNS